MPVARFFPPPEYYGIDQHPARRAKVVDFGLAKIVDSITILRVHSFYYKESDSESRRCASSHWRRTAGSICSWIAEASESFSSPSSSQAHKHPLHGDVHGRP
ncbi:hypothetical protein K438DRAFT_1830889 [Mycena galopus ATCC 62051]|nr:hypothetical protein K438DRAFT_1830889 [Mycena galopus ATCC 62051]